MLFFRCFVGFVSVSARPVRFFCPFTRSRRGDDTDAVFGVAGFLCLFFSIFFYFFYFGNRNETSGSHCWFYRPRFHFFPSKSVGIDLTGFSLVSLNVTGLIYGHLRSFIEVCRVFYGFSSFFFGPLCNGFGRPLFFSFTWFYRVWSSNFLCSDRFTCRFNCHFVLLQNRDIDLKWICGSVICYVSTCCFSDRRQITEPCSFDGVFFK